MASTLGELVIDDEYYDETDNELNLLDFGLGNTRYCINILKIREILALSSIELTELPNSHEAIPGIFQLRDLTISLIDLEKFFNVKSRPPEKEDDDRRIVLVCEFNQAVTGFLVNDTGSIHRLSWEDIQPVQNIGKGEGAKYITGRINVKDKMLLMLDFERIFSELNGNPYEAESIAPVSDDKLSSRSRHTIYFAEDSPIIRDILTQALREAGYGKVVAFEDGEGVYKALEKMASEWDAANPPVSVLVTDIEMPKMDGITLCRKIRKDLKLADLPVIVFSSMISDQMAIKCRDVGATEHISKPNKEMLLSVVDKHCLG